MRQQHKTKAILFLIIVLSMMSIACSGGNNNNPFEKIKNDPNIGSVYTDISDFNTLFGDPDSSDTKGDYPNYTYENIDFFGYNGRMAIQYHKYGADIGLNFSSFSYAAWVYNHPADSKQTYEKVFDLFVNKLTKQYGTPTVVAGTYTWYDKESSYQFELTTVNTRVLRVSMKPR